jgi:hypothetical protein
MSEIGLNHYVLLGALLFVCGAVCMAIKRNAIGICVPLRRQAVRTDGMSGSPSLDVPLAPARPIIAGGKFSTDHVEARPIM